MLILIGAVPERLVHGHQSRLLFPTSLAPPGPAIGFSAATLIQGTPVSTGVKGSPVPARASVSLQRNDYESHKEEEDRWLRNVHEILLDTEIVAPKNIS